MRARVKTQIIIRTDAATAFKYLSHTKYHHLWNPNLKSVTPIAQLKLKDTYRSKSFIMGVSINTSNHVTKFVQDKALEIQNKTGMLQYRINYQLVPNGQSVQLSCNTSVSAEGKSYAFARPLLEHLAQREVTTLLTELKRVVEKGQE